MIGGAEEFFKESIMDVVGIQSGNDIHYVRPGDRIRIASLEREKGITFLWVSWPQVIMPLIDTFNMTEDEALTLVKTVLNVDFVGFMPSFDRYTRNNQQHTKDNSLLDLDV